MKWMVLATIAAVGIGGCSRAAVERSPQPDLATALGAPELGVPEDLQASDDLTAPEDLLPSGDLFELPKTVTVVVGPEGLSLFVPPVRTVNIGDSVRWLVASDTHYVISGVDYMADGKFCSPDDMNCPNYTILNQGDSYTHTFKYAGTFPYFCLAHGDTATIIVH